MNQIAYKLESIKSFPSMGVKPLASVLMLRSFSPVQEIILL